MVLRSSVHRTRGVDELRDDPGPLAKPSRQKPHAIGLVAQSRDREGESTLNWPLRANTHRQPTAPLPAALRREMRVPFDVATHDLYGATVSGLGASLIFLIERAPNLKIRDRDRTPTRFSGDSIDSRSRCCNARAPSSARSSVQRQAVICNSVGF